jgi:hypothetical protein
MVGGNSSATVCRFFGVWLLGFWWKTVIKNLSLLL